MRCYGSIFKLQLHMATLILLTIVQYPLTQGLLGESCVYGSSSLMEHYSGVDTQEYLIRPQTLCNCPPTWNLAYIPAF